MESDGQTLTRQSGGVLTPLARNGIEKLVVLSGCHRPYIPSVCRIDMRSVALLWSCDDSVGIVTGARDPPLGFSGGRRLRVQRQRRRVERGVVVGIIAKVGKGAVHDATVGDKDGGAIYEGRCWEIGGVEIGIAEVCYDALDITDQDKGGYERQEEGHNDSVDQRDNDGIKSSGSVEAGCSGKLR